MKKTRSSITIKPGLLKQSKEYCFKNNINFSQFVENLIEEKLFNENNERTNNTQITKEDIKELLNKQTEDIKKHIQENNYNDVFTRINKKLDK